MSRDLANAPKEGRWIAKPRRPRWTAAALAAILPSQVFLWMNLFSNGKGLPPEVALLIFTVVVFGALGIALWGMRRNARSLKETEAMMDGNFGTQFPVEIDVVVEGKPIGGDRGVLWFADDRLGFSGRASSFVLAPSDLWGGRRIVRKRGGSTILPDNAFALRNAPREAYVVVTPLKRGIEFRHRLKTFLPGHGATEDERLVRYLKEPDATDDRQWPPLVAYEG